MVIARDGRVVAAKAALARGMNWRRVNFDDNRSLAKSIDIERPADAIGWLRRCHLIAETEVPHLEVLPGGVSSRTVLVERERGQSMVLKQSLAKLRVAVDWFSDPQRIHREALAIRWFSRLAPPGAITELFFEDVEEHAIAMEAVPKPHDNWKTMLLAGDVRLEHVRKFGELLAALHRNSAARAEELQPLFGDKTFFETLRVEPYYRYTAHLSPQFLNSLIDETLATDVSLVHGDFSPKNVLIHGERMVLLDHEVAHFGDPAFDIGFAMAHFLSKAHHLADLRERFIDAAQEFWRSYQGWTPYAEFERRCVRHSLACLLARVRGRSPLEYLSGEERSRQAEAILAIMRDAPRQFPALIERFEKELACR
jgi:aminoglycoside phosphotransferase (APT) family kinase protein